MSEVELEQAVAPVRDHFRGTKLNRNTVLAAHLRAVGEQPHGEVWKRAKQLLREGHSFEAAATLAAGASTPSSQAASESQQQTTSRSRPQNRRPASKEQSGSRTAASPQPRLASESRPPRSPTESTSNVSLSWFPKPFREGDLDGHGARRLLGVPNASRATVLVRETAQNSWDARIGGAVPVDYELHLRRATSSQRDVLRQQVFTGDDAGLGLSEALAKDDLWLLEISDRGTTGLGGPVRNDVAVAPDQPTDFIDFVFTIGAARDKHLGGGTYGFGKSISYLVSRPGAMLIWSRSEEEDGLQDRLIGSAVGYPFERENLRYTGRHWWGVRKGGGTDRVEPVIGTEAAALGDQLFHRGFAESETGTSLLIVDPDLEGNDARQDAEQLAESVLWHLWPKLLADSPEVRRTPMRFTIRLDGEALPIPEIEEHPILSGHAVALRAVRATQRGEEVDAKYPTEVKEIWCHRPRQLLGHLAFTRYPVPWSASLPEGESDPSTPIVGSSRHVCLMRHDAELVVRYREYQPLDIEGFQWAAVFKPVDEVDDAFAAAEPPAHDDWIPDMLPKEAATYVRVALRRIKESVSSFLRPHASRTSSASSVSAVAIGNALADLVGPLEGSRATPRRRESGDAAPRGPGVTITETRLGPRSGDRRRLFVRFRTSHPDGDTVTVTPQLRIGIEDGSEEAEDVGEILGWCREEPDPDAPALTPGKVYETEPEEDSWLVLETDAALAVDVRLKVAASDAA